MNIVMCRKNPDHWFDLEVNSFCPHCGGSALVENNTTQYPFHLTPGTILRNRYQIGIMIAQNPFDIVYQADDAVLQKTVAVKEFYYWPFMERQSDSSLFTVNLDNIDQRKKREFEFRRESLRTEAELLVQCKDIPGIPKIYDCFEANNTIYIVMELLQGQCLDKLIRQNGSLKEEMSLSIFAKTGESLAALHSRGIIHRDIAPHNIYIGNEMDSDIKIFGLVEAIRQNQSGGLMNLSCSPGYSPVEQYERRGKVGPWSDVYALGATLYVMLTGVKPEESTNRLIEDRVMFPHEINPEIPQYLSNAIMRALAVRHPSRFQTVEEFMEAVFNPTYEGNGKRIVCPYCGGRHIARILYGLPMRSLSLSMRLRLGKVALGGCCISKNSPLYHCNRCGKRFS